jgi:hypothetical protein
MHSLWIDEFSLIEIAKLGSFSLAHSAIPRPVPLLLREVLCGYSIGFESSPDREDSPSGRASRKLKPEKLSGMAGVYTIPVSPARRDGASVAEVEVKAALCTVGNNA